MSLDQKEREREMVSRLLSDLYPDLLTTDDVVREPYVYVFLFRCCMHVYNIVGWGARCSL